MCASYRIAMSVVVCAVVVSGNVHGPRRSRRMDVEDYAQNEIDSGRADESSWWPSAEFTILQKVYDDCSAQKHLTTCLKGKALTALTRAVEQESVQLADGLTLVKQADSPGPVAEPRFFPGMSTEDKLDTMLRNRFEQLLNTHTISMDLTSEGRGRGKKVMPYLLLGIFTTVSIVGGIALKTLAAIAGKALIASKVALTIAGIIALKKLFSHDGSTGETTFQVHADGHHRRNLYVVRPARSGGPIPLLRGTIASDCYCVGTRSMRRATSHARLPRYDPTLKTIQIDLKPKYRPPGQSI